MKKIKEKLSEEPELIGEDNLEAEAALARAAEKANADAIAAIVALTDAEIEEAIAAVAQA